MAVKIKVQGANYKFERSGFFGTGTRIKIYRNGDLLEEMDFEDMNGGATDVALINEGNYFAGQCEIWANCKEAQISLHNTINSIR